MVWGEIHASWMDGWMLGNKAIEKNRKEREKEIRETHIFSCCIENSIRILRNWGTTVHLRE
jgi:hypothetical protein